MPHFGAIDESLEEEQALLMRARLHVRGGWIRFSEGRTRDAIAAIYDALSSSMQIFSIPNTSGRILKIAEGEDPSDDLALFKILKRSGVFDDSVSLEDFMYIAQSLDDALENRLAGFDETRFVETTNRLFIQLGVLPFDACALPDSITL
ncbi:MAG: hypothetical protein C4K48_05740 [Candidatus Thorarchaeota archaeon]|nr:MAG: hypothetical protein C4K48_05740 [Candidatus Thorarchaeota archaeon]